MENTNSFMNCDDADDSEGKSQQAEGECSTDDMSTTRQSQRKSVSFGDLVVTEFPICLGDSDVVTGTHKASVAKYFCFLRYVCIVLTFRVLSITYDCRRIRDMYP